jgi:Flp pilus assembly protein TadG
MVVRFRNSHLRSRRRGAAMVETAIGLSLFLMVIFGIMEFGFFVTAKNLMNASARSAARVALSGRIPQYFPDGTPTNAQGTVATTAFLQTWVNKALSAAPVSGINAQFYQVDASGNPGAAWDSAPFGSGIMVDVQANYLPLFTGNRLPDGSGNTGPMVGTNQRALRARAYVRSEANETTN